MKKILFLVAVGFLFFHFAYAADDHLLINQIQITGGSGKTTNDFIEIFNPTNTDLDLKGFRLIKRTKSASTDTLIKSFTDSTIVKAGGYYLWANSNYTDIAVIPDVTTSGTIADDNSIALRNGPNDTGIIIDSVGWGSVENNLVEESAFATNPQANKVLLRVTDTDNNSVDFIISDPSPHNSGIVNPSPEPTPDPVPEPQPEPEASPPEPILPPVATPQATPSPEPSGGITLPNYSKDIIISEFLPNPDGKDDGEEWIELFYKSTQNVDLAGWIIDDDGTKIGKDAYIFPSNSLIQAQNYLVVNLSEDNFSLNNSGGDMVRLFTPDKNLNTSVSYTTNAKIDYSYALLPNGQYDWTQTITKGSANQISEDLPKEIQETIPVIPAEVKEEKIDPVKILINEIFPQPARKSSQEEFIELLNPNDQEIDLTGFKLEDAASSYKLNGMIAANGFMVINKSVSNISLNNSGSETLTLSDPKGNQIAALAYSDAPAEESYNLTPDGNYVWSASLTPGKENKISKPKILAATVLAKKSVPKVTAIEPIPLSRSISGANFSATPINNDQKAIWPWLAGSFAVNLLFCYSLVKLMTRKGNV